MSDTDLRERLRELLTEILEARGPFKLDNHEFAISVIESSQKNAQEVLTILDTLAANEQQAFSEAVGGAYEGAAQVGHKAAFEFLGMQREQKVYSWHDVEDALIAGSNAVRSGNPDHARKALAERDTKIREQALQEFVSGQFLKQRDAGVRLEARKNPVKVVCLCGSTRFTDEMLDKAWLLAKQGVIALGWNVLPSTLDAESHGAEAEGVKEQIDELHKRKIDLCDEVFVLNIGGYIGESTRSEINYAVAHGKPIFYAERELASLTKENKT